MSNQGFELTDSELKNLADMELLSRRNRLATELQRTIRELDTRVRFSTDYYIQEQSIRLAQEYLNPKPENVAKPLKPLDKVQKQQQELLKNLAILKEALVSGKVSKAELLAKFGKKG